MYPCGPLNPSKACWYKTGLPCAIRGAQFAKSPGRGAPPVPAPWQRPQVLSNTRLPSTNSGGTGLTRWGTTGGRLASIAVGGMRCDWSGLGFAASELGVGEGLQPIRNRAASRGKTGYRMGRGCKEIEGYLRIRVLLPNKDSIRSTATSAVRLRISSAGFSSTTSSEASLPVSAIISMHNWASR